MRRHFCRRSPVLANIPITYLKVCWQGLGWSWICFTDRVGVKTCATSLLLTLEPLNLWLSALCLTRIQSAVSYSSVGSMGVSGPISLIFITSRIFWRLSVQNL